MQDLIGGLVLTGVALVAWGQAADLTFGQAARMGPGWFPTILAGLLGLSGLIIAGRALTEPGPALQRWHVGKLVTILLSIVWFALTIRDLGLIIAAIGLIIVSSLAAPDQKWRSALAFGAAITVFSALLFPVLLGLPLPVWPRL